MSELPTIHSGGISVESDGGVAIGSDLAILSLVGSTARNRYLRGMVNSDKTIYIQYESIGRQSALTTPDDGAYRSWSKSIDQQRNHTLIVERRADATRVRSTDHYVVVSLAASDDPAARYCAVLRRIVTEPIGPSWQAWLWRRARILGEAQPATTWGRISAAWRCAVPRTLRTDITAAITGDTTFGPLREEDA